MTAPADAKLHNKRRHSGQSRCVTHGHPSLKDYVWQKISLDFGYDSWVPFATSNIISYQFVVIYHNKYFADLVASRDEAYMTTPREHFGELQQD
jgi:hypothetical protein